jgi:hypothetical protein
MLLDNWSEYKDANWLLRDCLERDSTRTAADKADYYLANRNTNPMNWNIQQIFKTEEFKWTKEWYDNAMMDIEMEREYSEDHMYYGEMPHRPKCVTIYELLEGHNSRRTIRKRFEDAYERNVKRHRTLRQIDEVVLYKSDLEFIRAAIATNKYTLKQIKILFGAMFFSRMYDVRWTRLGTAWKKKQFKACFNFHIEKEDFEAVNDLFEPLTDWKPNTTHMHWRTKAYYHIGETEFDWIYPNYDNKDEIAYIFHTTLENNKLNLGEVAEEAMTDIRNRYCPICEKPFTPKSNRQKYCDECRKEVQREQAAERKRRQRAKEKVQRTEKDENGALKTI